MSIFPILAKIIRVFYVKTRVSGIGGALERPYSIFIANHLDSFGPLAIMCTLIHRLHPWVTHEVMNVRNCAAYIREDFIECGAGTGFLPGRLRARAHTGR